ncbi:PEPxxWA-CTERM sorting domain-containing protein [Glacieibacterium frigidum]|uniref:PEPxxWA-CTERM sorting domain-containing protein n=1 Tax=Glacieibacterium frigidum TaxID=2593303 RepID=UPI00163DC67A|nr:PEPxxWA-CTERM sorting domain-containing protein [Glacieibacterium frigidum]
MKTLIAIAAAASALVAIPAAAVTYDAAASFSPAANPSGQFTFGSYTGGVFTPFPVGGTCDFGGTICLTAGNYLGVFASPNGQFFESGTGNFPASTLVLHPGQNGELSVILFTAPRAGSYSISFSAQQSDDNAATQTVGYLLGGTPTPLADLTTSAPGYTNGGNLFLAQGQQVGVFVGNNGVYFNDATAVTFSASLVPEPATWGLLIAGFAMTGVAMRRRKAVAA